MGYILSHTHTLRLSPLTSGENTPLCCSTIAARPDGSIVPSLTNRETLRNSFIVSMRGSDVFSTREIAPLMRRACSSLSMLESLSPPTLPKREILVLSVTGVSGCIAWLMVVHSVSVSPVSASEKVWGRRGIREILFFIQGYRGYAGHTCFLEDDHSSHEGTGGTDQGEGAPILLRGSILCHTEVHKEDGGGCGEWRR